MEEKTNNKIDKTQVSGIISEGGLFSKIFEGFEVRESQIELLEKIIDAFNNNTHLISEAPTGTGKSIAYLLPAVHSIKEDGRICISTNTKALQDQLFQKDIPFLKKNLGIDIKVAIAKGKGNFVCLRKIQNYVGELKEYTSEQLDYLSSFKQRNMCEEEDYKDMPEGLWQKVNVDDSCSKRNCELFDSCPYFKNREETQKSQIIITNHHLLASDISLRKKAENFESDMALPACKRLVIDEAHNIESTLISSMTSTVSEKGVKRIYSRLFNPYKNTGLLAKLRDELGNIKFTVGESEIDSMIQKILILIKNNQPDLTKAYLYIKAFNKYDEVKKRVDPALASAKEWLDNVVTPLNILNSELTSIGVQLDGILSKIDVVPKENQRADSVVNEISSISKSIGNTSSLITSFHVQDDTNIRWVETYKENIKFNQTPVDVVPVFLDYIYPNYSSVVFTSATIASNKNFEYAKKNLGLNFLDDELHDSVVLESPFDYKSNSRVYIPKLELDPAHQMFTKTISPMILQILAQTNGRAFILFTSFSMLQECYNIIGKSLKERGIKCLLQGELSKREIIETFKSENSVLFGTSTFWEGIDIPGEMLQCVIIPKLPFQVPTDPLVQAKMEMIEKKGGSSFMDYMLPESIIRLKQGFGRLIRTKDDFGSVWFFDNRLYKKSYGKKIVNSLPKSPVINQTFPICLEDLSQFSKSI